ncbi:MAG: hypothetical protein FK733_05575 [Asgard group archaeon]|nr:hypothetical protein [Asgard group archaeon]
MAIIFRELNTEENQIIRDGLSYWLSEELFSEFVNSYCFMIGEGKWKEIFLITNDLKKLLDKHPTITPYTIGLGLGEIKQNELLLSLSGSSIISPLTTRKAIISQDAEQPFLYKNHILAKSVLKCSRSVQVNEKLLVTNEMGDLLGIGQLKIQVDELSKEKNADHQAIYNILDLGWYLRKGK